MKLPSLIFCCVLGTMMVGYCKAATYPERPIRLIAPFAPGQGADVSARIVGRQLSEILGQPVVIENKPGAGGTIAAEYVANSAPDGYTLLIGAPATHGLSGVIYGHLRYDPLADFIPVGFLGSVAIVVSTNLTSGISSFANLLLRAKQAPRTIDVGVSNPGARVLLSEIERKSGATFNVVNYKTSGTEDTDLIAGIIHVVVDSITGTRPLLASGKAKGLAISSKNRSTLAPDVPTIAESGFPDFELLSWNMLYAPSGTPTEIVSRLNAAMIDTMRRDDIRKRLRLIGYDADAESLYGLDALKKFGASEYKRWTLMAERADLAPK